jgi:hypothetical protein
MALETGLAAAVAAGDVAGEAWAAHQLGSRALGLGDRATATDRLSQAIRLRESIHDDAGLQASRHNLGLAGGGGEPPGPSDGGGGGGGGFRWGLWLSTLGVLAVIAAVVVVLLLRNGEAAALGVNPAAVPFGNVTVDTRAAQSVAVANQGGTTLTITGVDLEDATSDAVTIGGDCLGAQLDAGESCHVDLAFAPSVAESFRADLVITDDTGADPLRVPITGDGVTERVAGISFDPGVLQFPPTVIGGPEVGQQTLSVTNTGQADLTISGVEQSGATEFVVAVDGCGGGRGPARCVLLDHCAFRPDRTQLVRGPAALHRQRQ